MSAVQQLVTGSLRSKLQNFNTLLSNEGLAQILVRLAVEITTEDLTCPQAQIDTIVARTTDVMESMVGLLR